MIVYDMIAVCVGMIVGGGITLAITAAIFYLIDKPDHRP